MTPEEIRNIQWTSSREIRKPEIKLASPPRVDEEVSKIVGKRVLVNDSKLIHLVAQYEKRLGKELAKGEDDYLKRSDFIRDLKEVFK